MVDKDKDKHEELKRQHAAAITSLRSLYEENPELEAEAPEGLPELIKPRDEADDAVPEPPDTDAVSSDDAAMEPEAVATPTEERDHLKGDDEAFVDEAFLSPKARVFLRENRQMWARKRRLGKEVPDNLRPPSLPDRDGMNLDDAEEAGVRDPERDDIRELGDLAFNMHDYNRQLIGLLNQMQDIMMDGLSEMEAMRARFARMR